MRIRTLIILLLVLVLVPPFWLLTNWVLKDLKTQHRTATEEPLVDAANLLATIAESTIENNKINITLFKKTLAETYKRKLNANIYKYTKDNVNIRLLITDANGILLFDSLNLDPIGSDFSNWRDIYLTLRGQYGTRTSLDMSGNNTASTMYVAAPITVAGKIYGVLSLGKPSENVNLFVTIAKQKILFANLLALFGALIVGLFLSTLITTPIAKLETYAKAISKGGRPELPKLSAPELSSLAKTLETTCVALDGKKYIENYVQTLTHEIKSPIAAIRGASELLNENPEEVDRKRFLSNITEESKRIEILVESLLQLSKIEARKINIKLAPTDVVAIIKELSHSLEPVLKKHNLSLILELPEKLIVNSDGFLLRHGIVNLLQNAIDFSESGKSIKCQLELETDTYAVRITDQGSGIPDYALPHIFDRFYSHERPHGKKSSGLGLSFVKEAATLLAGNITIKNLPEHGVEAVLKLPLNLKLA